MKLFTIAEDGKLTRYKEQNYEATHQEEQLEALLEKNPEYFFEGSNVLVIGRQVTTNLNTFIDLLGIDKAGNTVVIELKRGKTPRETVAQVLEYASFVENLDFAQLDEIYKDYSGEDISLAEYHQQYFDNEEDEQVSFNKSTKLVIVAQDVTREIRQTALFLRKKGVDIYCMEFKYFQTSSGEQIISSDFVVGEEEFIRQRVQSASLPKVDSQHFLKSLDSNGLKVFQQMFGFAKQHNLLFRWGSKGFSLNVEIDTGFVGLFFGYPPDAVFKQSIYTGFESITKKVNDGESIVEFYKTQLERLGYFVNAKSNLKWVIDKPYSDSDISRFLKIVEAVIDKIKEQGLIS
jgi:hypothetical protein